MKNALTFAAICGCLAMPLVAQKPAAAPTVSDADALKACTAQADKNMTEPPTRMPILQVDQLTDEQKKVAMEEFGTQRLTRSPGVVGGPYAPMLRSPEVLKHMKELNVYLQENSALPNRLRQFIIMMTARQMGTQYTYVVHCPQAVQAGISTETAEAIGEGRRPPHMQPDEEIVYDFVDELYRTKGVSDDTYARAVKQFGEKGVIDLASINGFYTFFLMVGNVARVPWHSHTAGLPTYPH